MKGQRQGQRDRTPADSLRSQRLRAELHHAVLAYAKHTGMIPSDCLEVTIAVSNDKGHESQSVRWMIAQDE